MGLSDPAEMDGGYAEALEALRDALRRDADREIRNALVATVRLEYGYKSREIQQQLGVSAEEMRSMSRRLERAAKSLRDGLA